MRHRIEAAWAVVKALAPYALIELLLPGGSVLAILYWLHRRRRAPPPGFLGSLRIPALVRR